MVICCWVLEFYDHRVEGCCKVTPKFTEHAIMFTVLPSVVSDHTRRPASAAILREILTSCAWVLDDISSARKYPTGHFQ